MAQLGQARRRHEYLAQAALEAFALEPARAAVVVGEGVEDLGNGLLSAALGDLDQALHLLLHPLAVAGENQVDGDDRHDDDAGNREPGAQHGGSILRALSYTVSQRIAATALGGAARIIFGLTLRHGRQACRYHFSGPLDDALRRGEQVIVAGWHQDVLPLFHYLANYSYLERTQKFRMMSSRSFDGEVTERIMRPWGFRFVRGSYGKIGAGAALRGYLRAIKGGDSVVIIADGPRPPPAVFRPGAVVWSRAAGLPLYVCRAWARPQRIVPSTWFRLTVPGPQHHCGIWSAGPIDVSGDGEQARFTAEREMARLGEEVDAALYLRRSIGGGVILGDRPPLESPPESS